MSKEKQAAKYVNSPDSDIYNKSRILYGLFQARAAIAKADKCYLVEGNLDVISMHQSGVENTVASCGTSLTTEQIRLIKRYTPNVTVLYDGDSAGIKAALRAVDLLFAEGMHVRLVLFPDGEDPDSYAQKYGSSALQEYLAQHEDNFIMFKTRVLLDGVKDDPIRRAELVSETARSIALVSDLLERSEYIRQCSFLLKVSEEALADAVGKAMGQARKKAYEAEKKEESESAPQPAVQEEETTPPIAAQPSSAPTEVERHLVQMLLLYGNEPLSQEFIADDGSTSIATYTVGEIIVSELRRDNLSLSHPLCQRIFEQCALMLDMAHKIDADRFKSSDDDALRTFAISLMMDTYSLCKGWEKKVKELGVFIPKPDDNLLQDVTDTVYAFKIQSLMSVINERREALRGADTEREREILMEINQYSEVLRNLQKAKGMVIAPRYY